MTSPHDGFFELRFEAGQAGWTGVTIPVSSDYQPGNPLHVRFDVPGGVNVAEVRTNRPG